MPEAVEEVLVSRQEVQNFMELSKRILHHRRAGPSTFDVRHDLVRDACDAGEVRVVRVMTRTCSLSRQIYRSSISMRRQPSM